MSAYYAVKVGRSGPCVYRTWDEARAQVEGFAGAVHKKFKTAIEASAFLSSSSTSSASSSNGSSTSMSSSSSSSSFSSSSAAAASSSSSSSSSSSASSSSSSKSKNEPACRCGKPSVKRVSKKDNANYGREFFTCARSACNYFKWVDDAPSDGGVGVGRAPASAFDLVLYTDGGCKGNQNVAHVVNPAGWGVVVVGGGAGESDVAGAAAPLAELFGPVVTDPSDAFHLGAAVCSNNTGELTAIGEALLWLRDGAGEHVRCACAAAAACTCRPCAVSIRYDSNYAAKSVMGEFNGEKNKPLITAIRRVYDALRCPGGASACAVARGTPRRRPVVVTWTKVKAHSGDRWNERADQLASLGIQGQVCAVGRYRQDVKRAAAAPVVVVVDDDDDNDDGDDEPCPKKQRLVDY